MPKRFYLVVLLTLAVLVPRTVFAKDNTCRSKYVRGYYRSNGTYAASHYHSGPDGNSANNRSTRGNFNPYTGKAGT